MLSEQGIAELGEGLPFYKHLNDEEKKTVNAAAAEKTFAKGQHLYNGGSECVGLIYVRSGQLRAYMTSEEGKEITLYRLLDGDVCILSASCMLKNVNFDIHIEFEKDSFLILIPTNIFEGINNKNLAVKEYTLDLVSSRFSDVMWVLEQLVFSPLGKRLAAFLLDQSALEQSDTLHITHEFIAKDLGSAREVITRMLKYFQDDGLVRLSRSSIEIVNYEGLRKHAG